MWDNYQCDFIWVIVIINYVIPCWFLTNIDFIFSRSICKLRYFMWDHS